MQGSRRGKEPSDTDKGTSATLGRRPLLGAIGAVAASGSMAGCLTRTVEETAEPLSLPAEEASAAGYESEPEMEEVSVERESGVGPATIKAEVTSFIVRHDYVGDDAEQESLGYNTDGENTLDATGMFQTAADGTLTLVSTPAVEQFGQEFNDLSEANLTEIVRDRSDIFEAVCECSVGDTGQVTTERTADPAGSTGRPNGNAVYVGPEDGSDSSWNPPSGAEFLGQEISPEDVVSLYLPTVEDGAVTGYYIVGTGSFVPHERTDGGQQFGMAVYTGRREHSERSPDESVPLIGPDGLFEQAEIDEFNRRFGVVLRTTVSPA